MTLKERLKAKETKLGKILKTWVAGFLIFCSALGAANEYLAVVPTDIVPVWLKTVIVIAGVISFVAGKLTVHNEQKIN
jgi:hypothetical protein